MAKIHTTIIHRPNKFKDKTIQVTVRIYKETEKSYLFNKVGWLSKTQFNFIEEIEDDYTGFMSYKIELPQWLYLKTQKGSS